MIKWPSGKFDGCLIDSLIETEIKLKKKIKVMKLKTSHIFVY